MSQIDIQELLRQVAELETSEGEVPEDSALAAYRSGELPAAQARELEAVLARNPAARRRLLEAAGMATEGPSPRLRQRVLDRFPASDRRPGAWPRWSLAAALAAGLILAIAWPRAPEPLPETLAYDVRAFGIATSRAEPETAGTIRARPDTVIRLEVSPRGGAESDVELGVYRRHGARLERVLRAGGRTIEASQGAAVFTARASELVGDDPGIYSLFVAAARRGDLPATVAVEPGRSALSVLADGTRRRVYVQSVELIPASERQGSPAIEP